MDLFHLFILGSAALAVLLWWCGAFSQVDFHPTQEPVGPFIFAYSIHMGAYKKVSKLFKRVCAELQKQNLTVGSSLGIYYDDPHTMPEPTLRSDCGFLLTKEPDAKVLKSLEAQNIRIKRIPRTSANIATFPLRNFICHIFAVIRTYKAAHQRQWIKCGCLEIGDHDKKVLTFAFPQDNLEHFRKEPAKTK